MRRGLFCVTTVVLQSPRVPPLIPPRLGQSLSMQNSLKMEAERRRKLDEVARSHYEVVREERAARGGRAIGIDLGTTNSCLCYIDAETQKPKIIPSPTGSWVFPTAVTFDKNHEIRLFGEEARACVRASSSATLCSGKRLIGRGFGELGRVQSDLNKTNLLTMNEKGEVAVEIMGRTYTVVHIIAMFLRYLKGEAERFLGEPVELAVVSVPAYFTPQQKVATEDAALCAGFDVLEVIDEPSAACLTYTVLHQGKETVEEKRKRVIRSLVFDLGGGTLDCAVMEHDRHKQSFTLLATHGDPLLGGNDWDTVISHHFASAFELKWHIPIEEEDGNVGQSVASYRNLSLEAERAKIHFTHSTETYYGYNRAFHFSRALRDIVPLEATLTHEEYVNFTRPLRVHCLQCVEKLFQHTHIRAEDIDNVLLVGAMTRDPPVRHMLQEYFNMAVVSEDACPADYAVAIGAGIRSGMLQGTFPELTRNTRFVSGTVQSLRQGGVLRRSWTRLRSLTSSTNPNAIGQRWRGKAKGLSDEEIANYAKELVEFEAACSRRLLLERAENEANHLMRRVAADSNRKQGMQERRVTQLSEQLKFWQYMVHNFHDHEDELLRTVTELQTALDELDGLASDSAATTEEGTIDFSKIAAKSVNTSSSSSSSSSGEHRPTAEEELRKVISNMGVPPAGDDDKDGDEDAGVRVLHAAAAATATAASTSQRKEASASEGPKVLRRKAPLPAESPGAQELIQAGHPALLNTDVSISEATRTSFLEVQVDERAWREPPVPPGERGSWQEVKDAVEAGEAVGGPIPWQELQRPMTMDEMRETLMSSFPIDDPASPDHAQRYSENLNLQTMTITDGVVDMINIQEQLDAEDAAAAEEVVEAQRAAKEAGMQISAQMFR